MVKKLAINPKYKPPKTGAGELKTPVSFYDKKSSGPDPNAPEELIEVYKCTAEIYNPSMKDWEIMKVNGVKQGVTIIIRDPLQSYIPRNHHLVQLVDFRYEDVTWEIVEVRPDIQDNQFITILLGVMS